MADDLRTELVRLLRRALGTLPGEQAGDPPPSMSIPDDLARRIVAQHPEADLDRGASGVPVLSRLRPTGRFEDDWRARPTPRRPWPVVLVHGTGSTKGDWEELGTELRAEGWAVFAPDIGMRATGPLADSAEQLGAYIDAVLAATGAGQVVVVGHSQGGVLPRWWMRFGTGASKIRHLVGLAAPNHGTTMGGIISSAVRGPVAAGLMRTLVASWFGPAGFDQIRGAAGSGAIEALNAPGELVDRVTYTCIATRFDTLIQPPDSVFLHDPEAQCDVEAGAVAGEAADVEAGANAGEAAADTGEAVADTGEAVADEAAGAGKAAGAGSAESGLANVDGDSVVLASGRVRNLWVDSLDPAAMVTHDQMPRSRPVRQLVRADLDRLCREAWEARG